MRLSTREMAREYLLVACTRGNDEKTNDRIHRLASESLFEIFNYAVIAESFEIIQKILNYPFIQRSNVRYMQHNIAEN